MPEPFFNIETGSTQGTWPSAGGTFYWYNPLNYPITLKNCGTFSTQDAYTVPAVTDPSGGYLPATLLKTPNPNPYAFTDPAWLAPGQPHIQSPTNVTKDEHRDEAREVA